MDAFTAASPTYRNAQAVRAHPLPICAGEVVELPRRRSHPLARALAGFGMTVIATICICTILLVISPA